MATPTILDFYRYTVPRGLNVKQIGVWDTTASANIVTTAASGRIYFVQGVEIFMHEDTDLGANNMTITHSADTFGGVKSTTITFSSVEDILAAFAPGTEKHLACNYFGFIMFDVPSFLDPTESLTIAHSGGAGGITAGHMKFGVTGWHIASGDL